MRDLAESLAHPQSVIDGSAMHRQSDGHAICSRYNGLAAAPFGADPARNALSDHLSLRFYLSGDASGTLDLDDRLGFSDDPDCVVWSDDCLIAHDLVIAG